MRTRWKILLAATLTGLCTACGGDGRDEDGSHVLETQQQSLERAGAVEGDVAEAARRQRDRIEDAENAEDDG